MTGKEFTIKQAVETFRTVVQGLGAKSTTICDYDDYAIYRTEATELIGQLEFHFYRDQNRALIFAEKWY